MVVFVVKRYAVYEAEKWRYAVRKAKIGRHAVRQGGEGCHPHIRITLQDEIASYKMKLQNIWIIKNNIKRPRMQWELCMPMHGI